jgi:EAL domain-containing protein (putative c-di-GMP-specific phosphodiesterase class I)
MAVRFTEHILDLSLEALNRLSSDIGFDGTISVNIPPSALGDVSLTNRLISTVASKGVLNSRVMVEITETSVPKDISTGMDIEMRLRVHGFQLSIDDFGTGFSSLERLRSSPFDELKIDLVFVRDALRDPSAKSIVENSIRLGHSLEMKVVAEGVENAETLALLSELGCDIAQGYYISKPISMEDLCKWSSTRALHRVA